MRALAQHIDAPDKPKKSLSARTYRVLGFIGLIVLLVTIAMVGAGWKWGSGKGGPPSTPIAGWTWDEDGHTPAQPVPGTAG